MLLSTVDYVGNFTVDYLQTVTLQVASGIITPEIQLIICLVHACVAIVAALTDSRQSLTLLLSMFCVP